MGRLVCNGSKDYVGRNSKVPSYALVYESAGIEEGLNVLPEQVPLSRLVSYGLFEIPR